MRVIKYIQKIYKKINKYNLNILNTNMYIHIRDGAKEVKAGWAKPVLE